MLLQMGNGSDLIGLFTAAEALRPDSVLLRASRMDHFDSVQPERRTAFVVTPGKCVGNLISGVNEWVSKRVSAVYVVSWSRTSFLPSNSKDLRSGSSAARAGDS